MSSFVKFLALLSLCFTAKISGKMLSFVKFFEAGKGAPGITGFLKCHAFLGDR